MNGLKLVSVLVPTYKSNEALTRAVDSVLNQTYDNIEVIVVDDNDPDSTYRQATEMQMSKYAEDSRIKYIKHKKNKNGSAARNTAFRNSTGEYVCLLDDDDYYLPEKIEKQVNYMEKHPEFGASYTWRIEKNNECAGVDIVGDLSEKLLLLEFAPQTSSVMLRRECYEGLNGFDETYVRHQDFEFFLRFFERYSMGVVPEALMVRGINASSNRVHGQRLNDVKKKFFEQFEEKLLALDEKNPGFRRRVYSRHYADVVKDHIHSKNYKLAVSTSKYASSMGGKVFWRLLFSDILSAALRKIEK